VTVKIVTDSTSDLPREVAEELDITVVPVNVHFGDEVYQDGVDLSTDDFYRKLRTSDILPKTSAPAPGIFRETYEHVAQGADAIVSIHVSDNLSAVLEAARVGCSGLQFPISIIDSQTASMACGLLVITAARVAKEGASLKEITALVNKAIP